MCTGSTPNPFCFVHLQVQLVSAFIPSKAISHISLIRIFYAVIFMHVSPQACHEGTEWRAGQRRCQGAGLNDWQLVMWPRPSQFLALMTICTHTMTSFNLTANQCVEICLVWAITQILLRFLLIFYIIFYLYFLFLFLFC